MSLKLLKYDLVVKYVPGSKLYMADTLSRAFIEEFVPEDHEFNFMVHSLTKEIPMSEERKKK